MGLIGARHFFLVGWVRARGAKKGPPDDNETSLGFPERKEEEEQKKEDRKEETIFCAFYEDAGRALAWL